MGKGGPILPAWDYVTVISLLSHVVTLETNSLNFMPAFKIQKESVAPGFLKQRVPFAISPAGEVLCSQMASGAG